MSQKRQESRDHLNAEHDYRGNLHTEMEIHQLHKKNRPPPFQPGGEVARDPEDPGGINVQNLLKIEQKGY